MRRVGKLFGSGNSTKNQFLSFFREHAHLAGKCAEELSATLTGKQDLAIGLANIERLEHAGDDLVRHTHELLDRTYIPPFDRDHIISLSNELDDILDCMKTTVRAVKRYGITQRDLRIEAGQFCAIITQATVELIRLFDAFPNMARAQMGNILITITTIEDEADDLLDMAIEKIFRECGPDRHVLVDMIAWREIFGKLEEVTDHCNHAAQVLNSIARWEGI